MHLPEDIIHHANQYSFYKLSDLVEAYSVSVTLIDYGVFVSDVEDGNVSRDWMGCTYKANVKNMLNFYHLNTDESQMDLVYIQTLI